MARSANRSDQDGDARVSSPAERSEIRELSLEEVLESYEQPINEEQAWAVCFQCCRELRAPRPPGLLIRAPSSIVLHRDGAVTARLESGDDCNSNHVSAADGKLVQSMGLAIYRALDWGLDESEERELSAQLERLIEFMVGGQDSSESKHCSSNAAKDEGYSGQEEDDEEEEEEGADHGVHTVHRVMALCARRLANPALAPEHYQAVCRALFLETLELQTFLSRIRDAKEMLKKIRTEEPQEDSSAAELDALQHADWARLWVQLMKELRQGVKLKKVEEQPFNPLPTEFSLTPFEMLMQDIRSRKYKLRKVVVDGNIPTCVKRNAHELILDFIRSRPPLKPVSERSLPPPPQRHQSLHDRVLAEIRQDHKLRPVEPSSSKRTFGSLPCLAHTCQCGIKSTSCIDLSITGAGSRPPSRPRVLLKAPTLAEMEEMSIFEDEDSPDGVDIRRVESSPTPLKRDRSFSEHDLDELRGEVMSESPPLTGGGPLRGERPRSHTLTGVGPPHVYQASFPVFDRMPSSACHSSSSSDKRYEGAASDKLSRHQWMEEFSHPVDSLALTVDEVINVRRILIKAEMEKYAQNKELYNNLKKGKICCCCRVKFRLLSWPSTCLLCKRSCLHFHEHFLQCGILTSFSLPIITVHAFLSLSFRSVCSSCSAKMKIPYKKMAHIPVYTVGFHSSAKSHKSEVYKSLCSLSRHSVEEEFPHLYAAGCNLRDVCSDCTKFVADVISSSRRSLDIINSTPTRNKRTASAHPHPASQPHAFCRMSK
ncbi:protein spire homolog 2 isoform X2 [Puntigrus tetrazona]|uniref:protein spire homolog 2 isoform X2 n=1 Tax=Puntigrus tetrazona TaxID=1606681 RepID=UPI001C8AB676|nr:protein spire homolog 2 isoform X2 [Puntigrus tetrazona]